MNQKSIWLEVLNYIAYNAVKKQGEIATGLESKYSVTLKQKASTLPERKKAFANRIAEHKGTYDRKMLIAFYEFWSEANDSGVKMRWEKQPTFDVKKRLKRWEMIEEEKKKRNTKPEPVTKKYQPLT